VTEYNKGKLQGWSKEKVPDPKIIQMALWVQYCHALRISEVLNLDREDFDFEHKILSLHNTKTGKGKKQFTSIPPDFPQWVIEGLFNYGLDASLFNFNRQLMWRYVKLACKFANLDLVEQQDQRLIIGAWTHLIRKSRAKLMIELGAAEVMVKVKLRHTFSTTERYTKPDINALIAWERENIKWDVE